MQTLEALPHGYFWGALAFTAVQAARETCFPAKEVVDGSSNVGGVGGGDLNGDGGGRFGGGGTKSAAPLDSFDEKYPMTQPAPAVANF